MQKIQKHIIQKYTNTKYTIKYIQIYTIFTNNTIFQKIQDKKLLSKYG